MAFKQPALRSLDDATVLDAVRRDPVGFVGDLDRAVIDEVQRAQDPLLATKQSVDNDRGARRVFEQLFLATTADFRDLRTLAEACGSRFVLGLVLHDHDRSVPFGERLFAAPISTLWR